MLCFLPHSVTASRFQQQVCNLAEVPWDATDSNLIACCALVKKKATEALRAVKRDVHHVRVCWQRPRHAEDQQEDHRGGGHDPFEAAADLSEELRGADPNTGRAGRSRPRRREGPEGNHHLVQLGRT